MKRPPFSIASLSNVKVLAAALAGAGAMIAAATLGAAPLTACAQVPDANAQILIGAVDAEARPSFSQFRDGGVSMMLEHRCGSLDCHGQDGRPLRIEGKNGLRRPGSTESPTGNATTNDEIADNYLAVIGLEPEVMARVIEAGAVGDCALPGEASNPLAAVEGEACFRRLLLISKPLACAHESHDCEPQALGVEHKGGPVIAPGTTSDAYMCLKTWIQNAVDAKRCFKAAGISE